MLAYTGKPKKIWKYDRNKFYSIVEHCDYFIIGLV